MAQRGSYINEARLYALSRCTRGPGDTACRGDPAQGAPLDSSSCSICQRVRSAIFHGFQHDRGLELATEALGPEMPELPVGEHWNPRAAPPPPAPPPQAPRVIPKVRAYVRVGGANQMFRPPADARQPHPPPPPPPQAIGRAVEVGVAPVPISPARGGNAPACGAAVFAREGHALARDAAARPPPPPRPPPVGSMPPPAGRVGQVPSYPSASGPQGPASASRGNAIASHPGWVPLVPAGSPPSKAVSIVDLTVARRTLASGDALQQAKEFSKSLRGETGSVLLETNATVGRLEIASTVDGDEDVAIAGDALETNLGDYLRAVCAGDVRPASSHPMRLAKALVIGALRDKQSDFLNVGQCVADLPDNSQDVSLRNAKETMLRWRDFIIYLATLVASVFEPMRFDACLR